MELLTEHNELLRNGLMNELFILWKTAILHNIIIYISLLLDFVVNIEHVESSVILDRSGKPDWRLVC